jgi:hypothetical protein
VIEQIGMADPGKYGQVELIRQQKIIQGNRNSIHRFLIDFISE